MDPPSLHLLMNIRVAADRICPIRLDPLHMSPSEPSSHNGTTPRPCSFIIMCRWAIIGATSSGRFWDITAMYSVKHLTQVIRLVTPLGLLLKLVKNTSLTPPSVVPASSRAWIALLVGRNSSISTNSNSPYMLGLACLGSWGVLRLQGIALTRIV